MNQERLNDNHAQSTVALASLLFLKPLFILSIALLPVCLLLGAYAHVLPASVSSFIDQLHGVGIARFGVTVSLDLVLYAVSITMSLVLGLALFHFFFTRRARRLLTFLRELRARGFQRVPVLPSFGRDELGEIGRQMGYATLEFQAMRGKADSTDSQRSIFLTTVGHQLRTPLSELLWAVGDLRSDKTSEIDKKNLLVAIDGTLHRTRLIIEHLLLGAAVEEGTSGYVMEVVDVAPIVAKITQDFKPLSDRRQISLVFQPQPNMPNVYADTERLSLVVFDLIANAIDYTPSGGHVLVSVATGGPGIEVSVQDTGIGISESEKAQIFNKFYRSERARHMHPDGSGMGFYLAKNILEKHGTALRINSKEGKGTTVAFYLHADKKDIPR